MTGSTPPTGEPAEPAGPVEPAGPAGPAEPAGPVEPDASATSRESQLARYDLPQHGLAVFVVDATRVAREAEWRHLAGKTSACALGRLLAAAALTGGFLEGSERLSLQIRTEGELGAVTAEVDAEGNLRGYAKRTSLPELDRGEATKDRSNGIGTDGWLMALRATDDRVTYQGTVELNRGDVVSDVLRLLGQSEQRIAHLDLVVDYDQTIAFAGGVLVEALHDTDYDLFDEIGARIKAGLVAAALRGTGSLEEVLRVVVPEACAGASTVWQRPVRFRCRCSREKVRSMLASLPAAELSEMLQQDGGAEATCDFCNDTYPFGEAEVSALLAARRAAEAGPG